MAGGIDIGYDDLTETNINTEIQETINELDEMVNGGIIDQYEAARLKDKIMSGRKNCLA